MQHRLPLGRRNWGPEHRGRRQIFPTQSFASFEFSLFFFLTFNSVSCSIFKMSCNHRLYLVPECFSTRKGNPLPVHQLLPLPPSPSILTAPRPSPWQPPVCFPSLQIYLFWMSHVNGIIQYRTLDVWLLSFSKMSLRSVVPCVTAWLLSTVE